MVLKKLHKIKCKWSRYISYSNETETMVPRHTCDEGNLWHQEVSLGDESYQTETTISTSSQKLHIP